MAVNFYLISVLFMAVQSFTDFNSGEISIVLSLGKRFGICHYIIIASERKDISTIKDISKNNQFSAYNDYDTVFYNLIRRDIPPHKTAVIIKNQDETLKFLLQTFHLINPTNYSNAISQYIWMVFTRNTSLDQYFNLFIPYGCQFFVTTPKYEIFELYRFEYNENIFLDKLAELKEGKELQMKKPFSMLERRRNFNGRVMRFGQLNLRILTVQLQLFTNYHREIWYDIGKMMNFTTVDCEFRTKDRNDEDIDAGSPPVVFYADYYSKNLLGPTFAVTAFMHVKYESDNATGFKAYFRPFEDKIWIRILFIIIISTTVTVCLEYCSRYRTNKSKWSTIWSDFGFCALDSFCSQTGSPRSQFWSTRLAILFPKLASCIILPCYSAAIIAFLTVQFPKIPFANLEELAQKDNYEVSTSASFVKTYFESDKNPAANRIRRNMWLSDEEMPATITEGIELLCNRKNHVFLAYNDDVFSVKGSSCEVFKIHTPIFSSDIAMQLVDNSSFTNVFNKMLRKFYFNGVIKKMISTIQTRKESNEDEIDYQPLDLFKISFTIAIVFFGIASSSILFLLEKLHRRCNFKKPTTYAETI